MQREAEKKEERLIERLLLNPITWRQLRPVSGLSQCAHTHYLTEVSKQARQGALLP